MHIGRIRGRGCANTGSQYGLHTPQHPLPLHKRHHRRCFMIPNIFDFEFDQNYQVFLGHSSPQSHNAWMQNVSWTRSRRTANCFNGSPPHLHKLPRARMGCGYAPKFEYCSTCRHANFCHSCQIIECRLTILLFLCGIFLQQGFLGYLMYIWKTVRNPVRLYISLSRLCAWGAPPPPPLRCLAPHITYSQIQMRTHTPIYI